MFSVPDGGTSAEGDSIAAHVVRFWSSAVATCVLGPVAPLIVLALGSHEHCDAGHTGEAAAEGDVADPHGHG